MPEQILDPLERRAAVFVDRNNQIDLKEEREKEQQRLQLTPAEQTAYGEAFMTTPKVCLPSGLPLHVSCGRRLRILCQQIHKYMLPCEKPDCLLV